MITSKNGNNIMARISDIVKFAPLNTVGAIVSEHSSYFVYIKEVLKRNKCSLHFIDVFGNEMKRNISTDFYFIDFEHSLPKEKTESEIYLEAKDGMSRTGVYHLSNSMAHGYNIYKTGDVIILQNNQSFIFIEKTTGKYWKGQGF